MKKLYIKRTIHRSRNIKPLTTSIATNTEILVFK